MDSPLTFKYFFIKISLMTFTDGASVTETPERGSVRYASAPFISPIRYGLASMLGVGATLSACGALPSTLWARWSNEAGSSALQGGVAHVPS